MERMLAMIKILLAASQLISVDKIASQLKVSNKTVRNDLVKAADYLKNTGLSILKKPGMGIMIGGTEEQKVKLLQKLENSVVKDQPFSPNARKYYILKRLLMADTQIRIQELADELYVSRVTVHKTLTDVEEWLKGFQLKLRSKTNYGIAVAGEEENWRKAVVSLLAHEREQGELKEMLYGDYEGRIDYKTLQNLKNLINLDYRQLERIITQGETKLKIRFSDEAYVSFVIHVAIAIKRLETQKDICLSNKTLLHLQEKEEYKIAQEIGREIESSFRVILPESEIGYILLHLLGAKMQQNPGEKTQLQVDEDDSLAIVIAKEISKVAQSVLRVDFGEDKEFLTGLILHLRPTMNRLKYGLTLRNPILTEIKENYPEIYGVAWMTSVVFEKYTGSRITEEEIGYIALHIAAAVERSKKPFKALVVCASGIGTSQLLAARLQRCFRGIEIKNVVSLLNFKDEVTGDIDFIISTVPLPEEEAGKNVIQISPLLVEKDIKRMEYFISALQSRTTHHNGGILMLINESLVIMDMDAANKEEAIRQLALAAKQDGKINCLEEFIADVLERENIFSTGVGNGIGIPHGKSKAVKEAMFVFGKAKEGIEWQSHDGNLVNLIFLLGVPAENVNNVHLKLLSQLSMKLMDEDFIAVLKHAETTLQVLEVLKSIQIDS